MKLAKFFQKFTDKLLTERERKALQYWLAEDDVETIDWHKLRVCFEICLLGLSGTKKLSDEQLIYEYIERVCSYEIPRTYWLINCDDYIIRGIQVFKRRWNETD